MSKLPAEHKVALQDHRPTPDEQIHSSSWRIRESKARERSPATLHPRVPYLGFALCFLSWGLLVEVGNKSVE